MKTGRNPTMRHIGRTHGICNAWLSERFKVIVGSERIPDFKLALCTTDYMSADIFTKFFTLKDKWLHAMRLIGHCDLMLPRLQRHLGLVMGQSTSLHLWHLNSFDYLSRSVCEAG